MALKFDNKPGYDVDSDKRHNPTLKPKSDGSHDDLDEQSPAQKAKSDQMDAGLRDLIDKETKPSLGSSGALNTAEKGLAAASTAAKLGKGFTGAASNNKLTGLITRRRAAGGGVLIGGVLIALFIAFFSFGPLKLVHFGNLLSRFHFSDNISFTDNRVGLMRYFRSGDVRTLRLGRTFTNLAEKWDLDIESRTGLRSVYAEGSRRFIGYEVTDEDKAKNFLDDFDADDIDTTSNAPPGSVGVGDSTPDPNNRFVNMSDESASRKRSSVKAITRGAAVEGVPNSLIHNVLVRYGGVDRSPLKNLRRRVTDPIAQWTAQVRRERAERVANGIQVDSNGRIGVDADGDGEIDEPGTGSDAERLANEANDTLDGVADLDPVDPDTPSAKAGVKLNLASKLRSASSGPAILIAAMCAAKSVGSAIELKQYTNLILPMIRVSSLYMSIGSQIVAGENLSSEEIAVYAEDLFDPETGLDAIAAAPFATELNDSGDLQAGEVSGTDLADDQKPGAAGEKPAFFETLDGARGLGTVCAIEEGIGNLPIIKQVGDLSSWGIDRVLGLVGLSQEALIDSLVGALSGTGINYYARGAELGNYLMYGGRLAANMYGASIGAGPLSALEVSELREYQQEILREETKDKSFFARMFDTSDPDSFTSRVALRMPNSGADILNSANTVSFASLLGGFDASTPVLAEDFDYGFEAYGFSMAEREDPLVQNPYDNAEYVELDENLERILEKYGDCFNKTINLNTLDIEDNERERADITDSKCHDNDEDLLRYRFYLADRMTEASIGCFEGFEDDCAVLGFTPTSTGSSTTSLTAEGLNGYAIPCEGLPRDVIRINDPSSIRADWTGIPDSGDIGVGSDGTPIKVYIREACDGETDVKTVLIVSSIHGSENGGQLVGHELLFNAPVPDDVRVIVVPELNKHGILARHNGTGSARVNANGVNLNRNFDYRWEDMNRAENTTPGGGNYRGESRMSEPESQAISRFILSLGDVDLSLHYHDNLNYVGDSVTGAALGFASTYSRVADMPFGNSGGTSILQRGSLDGWQAETTGDPVILVELGNDQSESVISRNVEALLVIMGNEL